MLIACWSPKGGSGTTVVSVALALVLGETDPGGALLADLAGDAPAVLGLADPAGLGLTDWLTAETDVPDDALERLEIHAAPGLRLLPPGAARALGMCAAQGSTLAGALAADPRPVVADCGLAADGAQLAVAAAAGVSLLVLRPCYLALRRALAAPIRPSGVVLVEEQGRSLGSRDIEEVLQAPVRAVVAVEASVARAVDAGLLTHRIPRPLAAAARGLAASLPARHSGAEGSPMGAGPSGNGFRHLSPLRKVRHQ